MQKRIRIQMTEAVGDVVVVEVRSSYQLAEAGCWCGPGVHYFLFDDIFIRCIFMTSMSQVSIWWFHSFSMTMIGVPFDVKVAYFVQLLELVFNVSASIFCEWKQHSFISTVSAGISFMNEKQHFLIFTLVLLALFHIYVECFSKFLIEMHTECSMCALLERAKIMVIPWDI